MQISSMYVLASDALVIMGGGILISVLFMANRLFNSLPSKKITTQKYFLIFPVLSLILGYLSYLVAFWSMHDLIAPSILFTFALTLWIICKFSLQPTLEYVSGQNIFDPVMGVYNRRYLERRLTDEVARAQRNSIQLSIFMLNIDQIKNITSTYGHHVENQVLIHLGALLQEYVREYDEVARYGQNTILVMTPNTTIQDAHLLADRIRQRVAVEPLLLNARTEKEQRVHFNVSVGVATVNGGYDSLEKLLQRAEIALQRARQEGGNRVVVAEIGVAELKPLN